MYGWLNHDPFAPSTLEGVWFDRVATKTRAEEYRLARNIARQLPAGRVLDAATGYVPNWHVAPYVLAALGHEVDAIDLDVRTKDMPRHGRVRRVVGDITRLPYADAAFDLTLCLSTLEHVPQADRKAFAAEAARVTRAGGVLLVTADNYPGMSPVVLAHLFGEDFDVGDYTGDEGCAFANGKRVAYLVGHRRA